LLRDVCLDLATWTSLAANFCSRKTFCDMDFSWSFWIYCCRTFCNNLINFSCHVGHLTFLHRGLVKLFRTLDWFWFTDISFCVLFRWADKLFFVAESASCRWATYILWAHSVKYLNRLIFWNLLTLTIKHFLLLQNLSNLSQIVSFASYSSVHFAYCFCYCVWYCLYIYLYIYTPSAMKKRATLFWTITSAFLDGFQHFVYRWKKEWIFYTIVYLFSGSSSVMKS